MPFPALRPFTPLTACLVVLGRYVPRLGFLGVLLGDKSAVDPEFTYYQRLLARDQDEAADVVKEYLREHPPSTLFDELLVPALVLAKRDRDSGELGVEDEQYVLRVTREILDDVCPQVSTSETEPEASQGGPGSSAASAVLVFGCPAGDAVDELALRMLLRLLEPAKCRVEVISAQTLVAEVLARVVEEGPRIVVVAALPPGGLAQSRYLCKRLRAAHAELKVVVVRWGLPENAERRREELLAGGADVVVASLVEAREQVAPLVSALVHIQVPRLSN